MLKKLYVAIYVLVYVGFALMFNRPWRRGFVYGLRGGTINAAPSPFGYDEWCDWHEGFNFTRRCGA